MPTQKELETFRKKAAGGMRAGVEETSGSKLLDLMAVIQEMLGTDETPRPKKKKGK